MGGTRLWSLGPAEFGWVARGVARGFGWHAARGSGAGGPRSLDGWHAALEIRTRLRSWAPAVQEQCEARGFELGVRGVWMGDAGAGSHSLGGQHAASGAGGPGMEFGWGRARSTRLKS